MASTDTLSGYYQPAPGPQQDKTQPAPDIPFAIEISDPGWKSALPSYIAYKWADALLATSQVLRSDFGRIHRPISVRTTWWNLAPGEHPRHQIDATNATFTIVGPGTVGASGEIVEKVGYRTGWTRGSVLYPCMDINYTSNLPSGAQLRRTIRCQVKTNVPAQPGDSGSPYFRLLGDGNSVEFLGTCDAIINSEQASWFAPWSKIAQELGSLTVAP